MEQAEHHSRHRRDYKNPRCPARDRKSKRINQLAGHFPCTIPQISLPPYLFTTRRATTMMFPKVFYYYLFTGFAVFNLAVGDEICGLGGTKCQPCAINQDINSTL